MGRQWTLASARACSGGFCLAQFSCLHSVTLVRLSSFRRWRDSLWACADGLSSCSKALREKLARWLGTASKFNKYVMESYSTMRLIVSVGWTIYPLGYFFGYLMGAVNDNVLHLVYNLADFVNKIA